MALPYQGSSSSPDFSYSGAGGGGNAYGGGSYGGGAAGFGAAGAAPATATAPSTISQYAPATYQQFGGVPFVNPAMISPTDLGSYLSGMVPSISASLAPFFGQQMDALNESIASRGIFGSGAGAQLDANLAGQQAADVLQQAVPGALSELGSNQQAANAANVYDANAYGQAVGSNQNNYNQFMNTLLGGYLSSFAPPTSMINSTLGSAGSAYTGAYGASQQGTGSLIGSLASLIPYFIS
jgi:hypothetical protein